MSATAVRHHADLFVSDTYKYNGTVMWALIFLPSARNVISNAQHKHSYLLLHYGKKKKLKVSQT